MRLSRLKQVSVEKFESILDKDDGKFHSVTFFSREGVPLKGYFVVTYIKVFFFVFFFFFFIIIQDT